MSHRTAVMRLFTALELPAAVRTDLGAWGRRAAGGDAALRAIPGERLHVTLHFLGDRPEGELPALRAALEGLPDGPVVLRTAGALWLSPGRPHVLTCRVACDSGALDRLHAALGGRLASAAPGWTPERRALRPHVTVARVRRGPRPRRDDVPPAPQLSFGVPAVSLVRSHLGRTGARYEVLGRVVLRTGA